MLGLDILGAVPKPSDSAAAATAEADKVATKAQQVIAKAKKAPKITAYAKKAIDHAKNVKTKVTAATKAAVKAKAAQVKNAAKKEATPTTTPQKQPSQVAPQQKAPSQVAPQQKAPPPATPQMAPSQVAPLTVTRMPARLHGVGADAEVVWNQGLQELYDMTRAYGEALDDASQVLSLAEQIPQYLPQVQASGQTDLYNEGQSLLNEASLYDPGAPTDLAMRGARWLRIAKTVSPASGVPGAPGTPGATGAPTITGVAPSSGMPGTNVTLTGTHLMGATSASFNGIAAAVSALDDSHVIVQVPEGATSGPITLSTPAGNAVSSTFTVNPAYADAGGGGGGGGDYGGGGGGGGYGGGGGGEGVIDEAAIAEEEAAEEGGFADDSVTPDGRDRYGMDRFAEGIEDIRRGGMLSDGSADESYEDEESDSGYDPEGAAQSEIAELDTEEAVVGLRLRGLDVLGADKDTAMSRAVMLVMLGDDATDSKRSGTARDFGLLDMTYAVMLGAKLAGSQPLLDRAKVLQGRVINQTAPVVQASGLGEEVEALALEVKKITNRNPLDEVYQGPVFTQTQNDYFSGKLFDTATHGVQAAMPEIKAKFDAAVSGVSSALTTIKWVGIGAVIIAVAGVLAYGVSSFSKLMARRT